MTYFLQFIFSIRKIAMSSFRFNLKYELYINILSSSFSYSDIYKLHWYKLVLHNMYTSIYIFQ